MEKNKVKEFLRKSIPTRVLDKLDYYNYRYKIWKAPRIHAKLIKQLKQKETIKVAFFVIQSSVWKLDELYQLMERDNRFYPIIIVCPYTAYGEKQMQTELLNTYNYFASKKYNVKSSYHPEINEWMDIKKEIEPDVIFFANPYDNLTRKEYYITNFRDTLSCYIPYSFMLANIQNCQFNQYFHNICWHIFCETSIHLELARKYADNKGVNVVYAGPLLYDELMNCKPIDIWKYQPKTKKRIIWAPHHTIENRENVLSYSCFLLLSEFMLNVSEKYEDAIQIAFKPHPILRNKLNGYWGEEKTTDYYEKWETLSNGQLEERDYIDLFLTSDAMILDSISFITEYMITGKPSLFTVRDDAIQSMFNEFGSLNYELVYKTEDIKKDIIHFIENVVIKEQDTMKPERAIFVDKYLKPPYNKSASENVCDYLKRELK